MSATPPRTNDVARRLLRITSKERLPAINAAIPAPTTTIPAAMRNASDRVACSWGWTCQTTTPTPIPTRTTGQTSAAGKPELDLARWIRNPEKYKPGTPMPTYESLIDEPDALVLARWLKAGGLAKGAGAKQ